MTSPTERSMRECRRLGWHVQVVERWNPYARIRQDLFGCIDLIAIAGDKLIGIQATSGANHAARVTKAAAEPRLRAWLAAGGLFEVWSWSKRARRESGKNWHVRREELTLKLLPQTVSRGEVAA